MSFTAFLKGKVPVLVCWICLVFDIPRFWTLNILLMFSFTKISKTLTFSFVFLALQLKNLVGEIVTLIFVALHIYLRYLKF